jgi:two-component system, OmpR family, sensor kinase
MTAGSATLAMPARARRGVPRSIDSLPLRVRLVAVVLVLLLTALTLTGLTTIFLMRRSLMTAVDRDLAQAAVPTASQALDQLRSNRPGTLPTSYAVRFMPANGDAVIFGPPSTAERRQHPDIPRLSIDDPRVRTHKPFTVGSTGDGGGRWRVIAGATDADIATYAVAVSLDNVDTSVRDMRNWAILIDAAVMVACAITAWYGVRRAFRPLTQIEDTAAAIAAGDLTRRIPERTAQDEVSSLSTSLNVMLAQIEQSFAVREASEERMRQFVADASHELRTPLAAVRGYAELFRQGAVSTPEDVATAMRRIEDEATRMGGLVQDLLLLTRLDDQRPMLFAPVDLTVLVADAAQDARALDPTRTVTVLGLDGDLAPTVVQADDARLRQVLTNLVGNAVNHTPEGTPIEIAVGSPAPGRAEIQVRDHGPGVDPAKARRVFERFYRADPSRARGKGGGSGLGLAIVAAVVAAHRGKVGVAQTPGGGATFVVDLPTDNSQQAPSLV